MEVALSAVELDWRRLIYFLARLRLLRRLWSWLDTHLKECTALRGRPALLLRASGLHC